MAPGRWPGRGVAVPRADPGQPPMVQSLSPSFPPAPLYLPRFPFGFPPGFPSRSAFLARNSVNSSINSSSSMLSSDKAASNLAWLSIAHPLSEFIPGIFLQRKQHAHQAPGACCKSPATSACLSGCPLYADRSGAPTWQPAPGSLVLDREFVPGSREAGGVIPVQAPPQRISPPRDLFKYLDRYGAAWISAS